MKSRKKPAPTLCLVPGLVCLALTCGPLLRAQVASPTPADAAMLARYDKNHDGKLDAEELASKAVCGPDSLDLCAEG